MSQVHKHHIIPRHMGGSDDPSNIVELTIEEHAEAHRKLYEKYGKIEDKLAWKGLLGMIDKEDIIAKLCAHAKNSKWYYNPDNPNERKMIHAGEDVPDSWVPGRGTNTWSQSRDYTNVSDDHRVKTSNAMKKAWKSGKFKNRPNGDASHMHKANIGSKRKIVECPHCGKRCGVNTAARWHFDNCKKFEAGG